MKYLLLVLCLSVLLTLVHPHDHSSYGDQMPLGYVRFPLEPLDRYIKGGLTSAESIFSGITTFAKLPWVRCLTQEEHIPIDIAFLGAPFDTGTSYRPGARFGPAGIRAGSRRLTLIGGYNVPLEANPFRSGLRIVDCGDIPVT
ncbi:hypothetical protein BDZ94DRAFT_1213877 [Collybia nuda]|uniref:Agmatinase n=1 Tax=Collybia nuda TaxID=64659 RepID=A0A9P6CMH6_9AGAR|nr:hypothetical protein BDZ94DRAFT_1213877 [Collybia nuda]